MNMKRIPVIFIGLIALTITGIGIYITANKTVSPPTISKSGQNNELINSELASNSYNEYSSSILQSSINNRRVLFFYANWCPTCKPADQNFKANLDKIPEDVTVIRVNYNDTDTDQAEKDLAKKYGITYQHTFVQIDENGNEITKWNGGKIEELLKNIK